MQNKADQMVDNFISDYKKSIFVFVSFFVSVIVIRVVTKGDFLGGFSSEVTILSIAFLLISLLIMWYARWEINKQLDRYQTFYKNLKERYEDLLDKSDIIRILNNDKDFIANVAFIESKRNVYTKIWIGSVAILFIVVVTLFLINSFREILSQFYFITQIIFLCFTKNT